MKESNSLCSRLGRLVRELLFPIICSPVLLLSGCVIKPVPVPTRHFVLAPVPAPDVHPTIARQHSVEVGLVKMPSYLLRDSMAIRNGPSEIQYLETAHWAERLDRLFRETLEQNLWVLLAPTPANLSSDRRVRVSVNVQQFDVDTDGRGTLLAEWRLTPTVADKPIKSGQARLIRPGPSPRGSPQTIAKTLSALLAEFSQELAPLLRESAQTTE